MPRSSIVVALSSLVVAVACAAACSPSPLDGLAPGTSQGTQSTCNLCVSDFDCNQQKEVCAQVTTGATCLAPCQTNQDCTNSESCSPVTSAEGNTFTACLPQNGSCGTSTTPNGGTAANPDAGSGNSGNSQDPGNLQDAGNDQGGGNSRDAGNGNGNGNGNEQDAGNSQGGGGPDAGFTSTITGNGGTESQLYFAVLGDTRPADGCDTNGSDYPSTIITTSFQQLDAMSPRPPFVVTTGDYQYVDQGGSGDPSCPTLAATQLGYYMTARAKYSGVLWPAMGNHECDGYTDSDCGNGCPSGDTGCSGSSNTSNFLEFVTQMLSPIGESLPYYTRTVTATDSSWKATFIFTAPNYWTGTSQSSWVTSQISAAGTPSSSNYVIVIHHEDSTASSPPKGLSTIESAESGHETLSIVGHSHFWQFGTGGPYSESNARQLLVGNGGAPLTSGSNSSTVNTSVYGYTTIMRQSDGSLLITGYDESTGTAVNTATVSP
jgi:hypothetical protein